MVNKKTVIICTLIALIIIGAVVAFKIKKINDENKAIQETENNPQFIEQNTNVTEESQENEISNEVQENETLPQNTIPEQNQVKGEEEKNNDKEETEGNVANSNEAEENKDETAVNLVKKEWGETDNTVYYYIDKYPEDDNLYIITVRSKSTTEQLGEYEVNVETKTVTMK